MAKDLLNKIQTKLPKKKVTDKFFHITLRTAAYLKNYKENCNHTERYLQYINTKRNCYLEYKNS